MTAQVDIWSGPARIVGQGMVTTFGGNPLYFDLYLPEGRFAFGLSFRDDPESPGARVDHGLYADGVRFEAVNFEGDGRGSATPVLLHEIGENLLFLHFRTWRHGSTIDRTVHYTFFYVAKTDVGWQPVARDDDDPAE